MSDDDILQQQINNRHEEIMSALYDIGARVETINNRNSDVKKMEKDIDALRQLIEENERWLLDHGVVLDGDYQIVEQR